jgi:hypothetical protein
MKNFLELRYFLVSALILISKIAHSDTLLDFSMFNPPVAERRLIPEPVVSWVVRTDAQTFCDQVEPKDGFHSRPEGCVYWLRKTASCTIVTTNNTTHSQLGHLFVRCMQGQ